MGALVDLLVRYRLDHVAEGAIVFVPFAALGHPVLGWALVSAFYLGRERRDEEVDLPKRGIPFDPHRDWWRYWNPLRWGVEQKWDLFMPAAVLGAAAATIEVIR